MLFAMTRRRLMAGMAATAAGLAATPTWAQPSELMSPGPLGEMALGDASAPNTVIEYASLTCGHCASFHARTFPEVKEKLIDTGKVYFIFREFPLDPRSKGAFMLARCASKEAYFPLIDVLFERQREWAYAENALPPLFEIAKQAGFTQESFEACLTNQEVRAGVEAVASRAVEKFDVRSTPTFFVNGEKHSGDMSFEAFAKLIDN